MSMGLTHKHMIKLAKLWLELLVPSFGSLVLVLGYFLLTYFDLEFRFIIK
jgi:hypothetical protein